MGLPESGGFWSVVVASNLDPAFPVHRFLLGTGARKSGPFFLRASNSRLKTRRWKTTARNFPGRAAVDETLPYAVVDDIRQNCLTKGRPGLCTLDLFWLVLDYSLSEELSLPPLSLANHIKKYCSLLDEPESRCKCIF